jgi:hypothetical protein
MAAAYRWSGFPVFVVAPEFLIQLFQKARHGGQPNPLLLQGL